ncbi:copper amine oxidase [Aspergillus alliaceus]|uniref:Amine oxidase n=1 Tax=Petromyces alliaceus TaxID=209559 RepID=A0A5N7C5R0_PETAA|nr:copper amine oxidase [Aspergillus alliaceus]
MARNHQLVIQCTATVLNYEYILAFVLEQVANLHIYFKATGIVSIDHAHPPKTLSLWGIVVALCVLAVSHQHLFCLRIDPALDEVQNTVIYDDIKSVMDDPQQDLLGVVFRVHTTPITWPGGYDLDASKSQTYKIVNPSRINTVSGKPVGYKLHVLPSQMLMMGPETFN